MPNLFFSGQTEFSVTGTAAQIKAAKKAIKENEYGLVFTYELNDAPCIFYAYPFHMVSGSINVHSDKDTFKVVFDGIAKIPLDKSSVDHLSKKDTILNIQGLMCHPYGVDIDGVQGKVIASPLKVSKTAPKA